MTNWKRFFGAAVVLFGCVAGVNATASNVIAELEYYYAKDGTITGRRINNNIQNFEYDRRGQLTAVIETKTGKKVEAYVYDPAGNILVKTVNGKTTVYEYDAANQLVNSNTDGITTNYQYDGAGRLVKEGDKSYRYSYLDKLEEVLESGQSIASFDYHIDGQIASATRNGQVENFVWDGLALIHRAGIDYINEPAATGGNPILAGNDVLFNDMLGTTMGVKSADVFLEISITTFGQTDNLEAFFTGKPAIGEVGYAFLFRNYRAGQGKWQTQDLLGYPDGWNNFAYVNNLVLDCIDLLGGTSFNLSDASIPYSASVTDDSISVGYSGGFPSFNISDLELPEGYTYSLKTLNVYGTINAYRDEVLDSSRSFSYTWVYKNGNWVAEGGYSASREISLSPGDKEVSISISYSVILTILEFDSEGRQGPYTSGFGRDSKSYTVKE